MSSSLATPLTSLWLPPRLMKVSSHAWRLSPEELCPKPQSQAQKPSSRLKLTGEAGLGGGCWRTEDAQAFGKCSPLRDPGCLGFEVDRLWHSGAQLQWRPRKGPQFPQLCGVLDVECFVIAFV